MQDLRQAFLRLFFRLLYNELACGYDLVAWLVSLGQWRAWGQTALSHLQGRSVLELGHGPGHLLATLAGRGYAPVGLDLSPSMARQAQRRLHASDLAVPLLRAGAQDLPFRRDSFDSVVATFPTDFIVHPRTLREARRVLTSRGRLVAVLAVRFEGEDLISRFLAWLYRITGQSEPFLHALIPRLEQAGLSPRIVWERVNRAAVLLIVAETT
jgi:ubiquinone/menaquinone biosynthesis C-methylase UbiE